MATAATMISSSHPTAEPIRVLVVDPTSFSRECTVAGLVGVEGLSIEACATLGEGRSDYNPDILLFQIAEPVSRDSSLPLQLAVGTRRWPSSAALVVGDHNTVGQMLVTVGAGAKGLLPATTSVESIQRTIKLIVDGLVVYPVEITGALKRLAGDEGISRPGPSSPPIFDSERANTLTKRQQDVLELLALGSSNKTIAQTLNISESTVKVHIRAIMMQNGVSNRTQIVAQFLKKNGHDH